MKLGFNRVTRAFPVCTGHAHEKSSIVIQTTAQPLFSLILCPGLAAVNLIQRCAGLISVATKKSKLLISVFRHHRRVFEVH
jgi:hypothetical protein